MSLFVSCTVRRRRHPGNPMLDPEDFLRRDEEEDFMETLYASGLGLVLVGAVEPLYGDDGYGDPAVDDEWPDDFAAPRHEIMPVLAPVEFEHFLLEDLLPDPPPIPTDDPVITEDVVLAPPHVGFGRARMREQCRRISRIEIAA